ncbi:hypothetical protein C9J03_11465 [Photobacterium gaetbulicola]|uniref:Putative oxidoreductase/nitrogenase component 1 n=1 Tax=Photobacterium gaetbulicola Gung47 TaxID=658445 RepID=A0A0C5WVX9_9GAMM|nr:nitrogenase component 1 [Photobacterium gaetbulicola]AJR09199.1 putative oxidoreductase/nitrogenase component 1 [Photobacterium gaetbulicola Gung47]PSU11750.1 hypothetical protein C9J03_11465 [Photobacterium gaetbulicola]
MEIDQRIETASSTIGRLSELVYGIEKDWININESLDMHQFCAFWGASDVFSYINDCVVLTHGTAGCINNRRFLIPQGSQDRCDTAPHLSTDFKENDVVFGGEQKLEQAVSQVISDMQPKLLAVITNCCADIIGDDVGGIVEMASDGETKTTWLDTGGFTGKSYRIGTEYAFEKIVELMARQPSVPVKKKSVNVFLRRWLRGDTQVREIEESVRLMELMGLTVNSVFHKGKTFDEVMALREAEVNVALCFYFGMSLFQGMEEHFGTKMVKATTPVGLDNTLHWLGEIATVLDTEFSPELHDEITQTKSLRQKAREVIGKGRVAIIWTQTGERLIAMAKLAQDLGLTPLIVGIDPAIVRDKLKIFKKELNGQFDPYITILSGIDEVRALAHQLDNPVIFCNDDYFHEFDVFRYRFANNQVYGLKGAQLIYQKICDELGRRRSRYSLISEVTYSG